MTRLRDFTNDPRTQGTVTLVWLLMIPTSFVTGWIDSVRYISIMSLWALVASHGAWWAASSVGKEAPKEVVQEIVAETTVAPAP